VSNGVRDLVFDRTLVRVQPGAFTEMHIDTDEANAAGLGVEGEGALVAQRARLGGD
jgi:acetate kinase